MAIYVWLFILLFLMSFTSIRKSQNRDRKFFVALMILTFIAMVRGVSVGADTKNYIMYFNAIVNRNSIEQLVSYARDNDIEYGYLFYNKIISLICSNQQTITMFNSVFLMTALWVVVKKYAINKMESVYLFYVLGVYQTALNLMPSSIASLIALSGVCFIKKREGIKYVCTILLAMMIHKSVFVFLPFYFISRVKITKKLAVLIFGGGFLGYILYDAILPVLALFVPDSYLYYLDTGKTSNGVVFVFHILILVFVLLFVDLNRCDDYVNIYMWLFLMELVFYWLGMRLVFFSRISLLFTPVLILLLPKVIREVRIVKQSKAIRLLFFIMLGVQYLLRISVNNIGTTLPYVFFWNVC